MEERVIFAIGSTRFLWSDVERAGRRSGSWDALEGQARAGLAATQQIHRSGGDLPADELDAEEERFRYERDLLSGDELLAWLDQRGVALEEWRAFLARNVARRLAGEGLDPIGEGADLDPRVVEVDGLCSGGFAQMAERLAATAALVAATRAERGGGSPLPTDPDHLAREHADAVAELIGPDSIQEELAARWLDWTRFVLRHAAFADLDAGREAAMCVRMDGMAFDAAARLDGATATEETFLLEDAPAAWRPALMGALAGDLIGPLEEEAGVRLLHVVGRTSASLEDRAVRERARARIIARAEDRAVNDLVVWHADL